MVFTFNSMCVLAQSDEIVIPFTTNGANVMETQLEVNGYPCQFIFDTGASKVSFGKDLYAKLRADQVLNDKDVIAKSSTLLADGTLATVLLIRIDNLTLGNSELHNVDAMVFEETNAPPLLGQSALQNYGSITIDNVREEIVLRRNDTTSNSITRIETLRLVACNEASKAQVQEISMNTFTPGPDVLLVSAIDIENKIPPAKAIDRLRNAITIRYFDAYDLKKAKQIKKKISRKFSKNLISIQDMTPYYREAITNYFEIWINN